VTGEEGWWLVEEEEELVEEQHSRRDDPAIKHVFRSTLPGFPLMLLFDTALSRALALHCNLDPALAP
jgi:hypothetical protein